MSPDVLNFIESIIHFCKSVLNIPITLYTKGLEICPWVLEQIVEVEAQTGIDIFSIIPELQKLIVELDNIKKVLGG